MSKHDDAELTLTGVFSDRVDFEEDRAILEVMQTRIFRWAISADAELLLPPDLEKEAMDAIPELSEAFADFDAALGPVERPSLDTNAVKAELAEWKERLSVGQAQ